MKFKLTENAKKVLELYNMDLPLEEADSDGTLTNFVESISCSDGFWYGFTSMGYINIENIIADTEQVKKIKEAIDLLSKFELLWNDISIEF